MAVCRRTAAALALGVTLVVGWAPSASAHAILLRTQPSPQTTVKSAPADVQLFFSEPVEVAFGAVRVFDVDGRRVDRGSIRRAEGDRRVLVSTPGLKDGSYTVTWRVASADGHVVSGGHSFYVGAPSSISAVAIPTDQGAGRVVGLGFGAVRFVWFAALLGLVGLVAVRRLVWTPAVHASGLAGSPMAVAFRRRFAWAFPAVWLVLAAAGLLSVVFQAASVSGLPLASSARPMVIREVLRTTYGHLWVVSMLLTVLAAVPVAALAWGRPRFGLRPSALIAVAAGLGGGLAVVAALNGHARVSSHPGVMVASIAVHLLAVGVWVGGLAGLVVVGGPAWRLAPPDDRPRLLRALIGRFSRLAVVAVAVVVATGTLNAVTELASVSDLWRIPYGRAITAKVVLLTLALLLAVRHRRQVPARLDQPARAAATAASFRWSSTVELGALVLTVAVAAGLVALVPGRSLAQAANGSVNLQRSVGDYRVQLFIDPTRVGDNEVHVTFVTAQGLGAAEVATAAAQLSTAGTPAEPLKLRLLSPGHFVADTRLPAPGRYHLAASTDAVSPRLDAIFDFRLHGSSKAPTTTQGAPKP